MKSNEYLLKSWPFDEDSRANNSPVPDGVSSIIKFGSSFSKQHVFGKQRDALAKKGRGSLRL